METHTTLKWDGARSARGIALFVAVIVVSAGCGSVSFKAGADPNQIAQDEATCRASTGSEEEFVQCMRDLGYLTADLESMRDELTSGPIGDH
ncbi:MAG: hypothetical protein GY910_05370 [bacterium]|nr:hypothetical protein [Deltaproteobacteria bacterium]MCP4904390.1 hypothetical protein [bacterium]